jgi:glycosyltransferase involved in cell wall biosynthesis
MACGTPTIAYRRGSVPEVIDDGKSGIIVDTEDAAIDAVRRLPRMTRAGVRACFERRFTVERMAADYVRLYQTLPATSFNDQPKAIESLRRFA